MNPELQQLKREVEELKLKVKTLASHTTIPFEVEKAFRSRLGIKDLQEEVENAGNPTAPYLQSVNEGGVATYTVPAVQDGLLKVRLEHRLNVYVPYWDI